MTASVSRRAILRYGWAAAGVGTAGVRASRRSTDGAGRRVTVPARVERVFPAGPPAAIQLYTLAPELLLGWPRANRPEEREFLRPDIAVRPELGRLTGRGNTTNLETVLALRPDLIIDSGSVRTTYVELADRVQAQTGIPYALLDGRFDRIPESYRTMARSWVTTNAHASWPAYAQETLATVRGRCLAVPAARRPRVYYAARPGRAGNRPGRRVYLPT